MIYEFCEVRTNERVELDMDPARAPSIGKTIRRGGRVLRRIPSLPHAQIPMGGASGHWGVSHQLPKWWPHHGGEYRADGACILKNAKQASDNAKRGQDAGEPVVWDP